MAKPTDYVKVAYLSHLNLTPELANAPKAN